MRTSLALLLVLVIVGCGSGPEFDTFRPSTTRLPRASDDAYYERINRVGLSLLKESSSTEDLVVSPVGVVHNLAVLMGGSTGRSRDELLALLELTESNLDAFNDSQRALLNRLQSIDGEPFVSGTAVFSVWPIRFDTGYVEKMGRTYDAVVRKLGGATIEGDRLLHVWVEERISHDYLAPAIKLSKEQQILSLSCAGYFWNGASYSPPVVPTVTLSDKSDYTLVCIDTHDGFQFVALVPVGDTSITDLLDHVEVENFKFVDGGKKVESPSIPEIQIESETDLRPMLRAVGVGTIFGRDANLRLMSIETESGHRISEAVHKDVVYIPATKGTERVLSMPFVFSVMEKTTGAMVALGIVRN